MADVRTPLTLFVDDRDAAESLIEQVDGGRWEILETFALD